MNENSRLMKKIIENYLRRNTDLDFDEVEIVNKRPMDIWLHAKCRTYLGPDRPVEDETISEAGVEGTGDYDGNPSW